MRNLSIVALFLAILFTQSCAPTLSSQMRTLGFEPIPKGEKIHLLENERLLPENAIFIGNMQFEEEKKAAECGYLLVLELAKETARAVGANIVLLTKVEELERDGVCHHIKAKMYKSEGYIEANSLSLHN